MFQRTDINNRNDIIKYNIITYDKIVIDAFNNQKGITTPGFSSAKGFVH